MDKYAPPSDDEGWKDIIIRLHAYAEDQISIYSWYRGDNALPGGLTTEDFVQESIFRYLDNPSVYDPERGKFFSFLKYNILRRLVSNLSVLSENKHGRDIYQVEDDEDDNDLYYEDFLPGTVLDIENVLDFDKVMDLIIEKIDGETLLENIFEGNFISNLKRIEICKKYNISENDYCNAVRRLNTIIKNVKLFLNN